MMDKEEIIRTLDALANWQGSLSLTDKERVALAFAVEYIKNGAERPHGEWEHWGSPFTDDCIANSIVCSLCKARYVEIESEVFNFCPNCGADMRVKGELNRVSKELNSEIEKSKSEIVPDYRDGWRLRGEAECD